MLLLPDKNQCCHLPLKKHDEAFQGFYGIKEA